MDTERDRQAVKQTDIQTGRQTDRQNDLQTGRQAERQTDRQRSLGRSIAHVPLPLPPLTTLSRAYLMLRMQILQ